MKLTFWAPFAIAFEVFTLLVLYLLYKAVRWALGRGGSIGAGGGGEGRQGEGEGPVRLRGFSN